MAKNLDPNMPFRRVYIDVTAANYDAAVSLARARGVSMKKFLGDLIEAAANVAPVGAPTKRKKA